jgi:hypothetical protein
MVTYMTLATCESQKGAATLVADGASGTREPTWREAIRRRGDRGTEMGKIKKSVDINASSDELFDLLTDLDALPTWSTITLETHGTPRKPIEQGDTFTQTLRCSGGRSRRSGASSR